MEKQPVMIAGDRNNKTHRSLKNLFAGRHRDAQRGFLAEDEFHQLCKHEQLRSDRGAGSFSLTSLRFQESLAHTKSESIVTEVIENRIRRVDMCGFLSNKELGILTPNTPSAGASTLVADLLSRFPESLPKPSIDILEYRPQVFDRREDDRAAREKRPTADVSTSDIPAILVDPMPLWKRATDVIGAVGGLVILSPLFLILALLVKFTSRGPVFFAQRRTGLGGKTFLIYKFRSMVATAEGQRDELLARNEQDGPAFKIENDPRVTWIGGWLRKLSLDELPQLWNVLKGDMSFVGPRPLPCHEADKCELWQRRRLTVTPGITCTWQVHNRANPVSFADWMRMDIRYTKNVSMKHDFQLLARTAGFLLARGNR